MNSPSYAARIRRKVKDQIAGWQLPREMLVSVYAHLLTELPAHPDRHLHEPITRPNLWAYHFTLGAAPARRFFTFAIERRDYVGNCTLSTARWSLRLLLAIDDKAFE